MANRRVDVPNRDSIWDAAVDADARRASELQGMLRGCRNELSLALCSGYTLPPFPGLTALVISSPALFGPSCSKGARKFGREFSCPL